MPREVVNAEPWNNCFGCGQHNERGLRLRFTVNDDGTVETRFAISDDLVGPPGAAHGGIQAVLLDEVMGITAAANTDAEADWRVTAELNLRYRRPVPTDTPLVIRGRLLRSEGPNHYLAGEILGPDEEVLTRAEARFKSVPKEGSVFQPPPAG